MKVLLVLEATLGGTSRHILDLADGLLDRGVDVHLVYSTIRADHGFEAGLASLRAARPALRCQEIPITREVTISDIRSYLKLQNYLREHGPFDVIHAHSTKAGFLARLLLSCGGARVVYTPHGLMTMDPALRGLQRRAVCVLESVLARRSDKIVAVSTDERHCARATGIDPAKLTVIPNGIRHGTAELQLQRRFSVRRSVGLSPETVCIGYVGRFCSQKEPGRLVEAFSLLKQQTETPVRLAMIGSGALEAELREQVVARDLTQDVQFLGQVDGATHMPAFDILALTSHFEAFAYVFVEALSAGVPIVTTRVGAAQELIEDGVTGYVCDPWDTQKFADYLRILVDDPARRSAMSHAARERAAPYTVSKMVDSVAQLYDRICARPSLAPSAQPETSVGNSR